MQCFWAAKRRTGGTAQVSWPLLDQNEKKYEFDWDTRDQHEQMCEALSVLDNHEHQISWRCSTPSELHLPKIREHQSPLDLTI